MLEIFPLELERRLHLLNAVIRGPRLKKKERNRKKLCIQQEYIQFILFICNRIFLLCNSKTSSDRLSEMMSLAKLLNMTSTNKNYFLFYMPPTNRIPNFIFKMMLL